MYDFEVLKEHANNIRKNIVKTVTEAKSGHPGGSLSAADIFTYLYFEEMNVDPKAYRSTYRMSYRTLHQPLKTIRHNFHLIFPGIFLYKIERLVNPVIYTAFTSLSI